MVIFMLLIVSGVKALVNPYGPTVISDLTNCLSELIDLNFKESGLLIFANTKNVSSSAERIRSGLLKKINEHFKYSVQVKSPTNEPAICVENSDDQDLKVVHMDQYETIRIADYFIVVIDSYTDFTHVASRIIRSRNWNPHAKFLILFFHFVDDDNTNIKFVEQIVSCLFKHNAINVAVAVPQATNIRNTLVYSWKPFNPPKYCGYYNETATNRLLLENACEHGSVRYKSNMFQRRVPDDMTGCILYILALERQPFVSGSLDDPNIEKQFINQLAQQYNFETRYEIINAFRGERDEIGNWDGALKELVAKKGHLLLGGIFPDFDVHEDFECSTTYLADSYTWVVPRAPHSAPWLALIMIFKRFVWYSVIAGYILCVFSWRIIGQLSGDSLYHKTIHHCFLNTWICHAGFVAYARPVKQSLRVFFVFLNLYCILFLTAYQTKLFDVLTYPTFEEQIDTIEELVNSGLKWGGYEELFGLFENSSDPFDYLIGEKWITINNITQAMIDVTVHRNFSVLCSRLELSHLSAIMPELSDRSGKDNFFAFEMNMFTVPQEMVALRGFAFMQHFSLTLEMFKQLGINELVRKSFASINARRRARLLRSTQSDVAGVSALSVQHLQGGFLVLAIGFIGGILVLLIEIIAATDYIKNKIVHLKDAYKKKTSLVMK